MPKYRQLHTKIVDSYDFNDMPDDFTRVFWILLTVTVDSEGRALDNSSWLRSRMFPLRENMDTKPIDKAMDWLSHRRMIIRYSSNGRNYFYIPTFKSYQSGTEKEAKSVLPEPPELLQSYSKPTTELVDSLSASIQYNTNTDAKANTKAKSNGADAPDVVFPESLNCDAFKAAWSDWEKYKAEAKQKLTPTAKKLQLKKLSLYAPETAIEMIMESIEHNWKGIFQIKNNGHVVTPNAGLPVDVGGSF